MPSEAAQAAWHARNPGLAAKRASAWQRENPERARRNKRHAYFVKTYGITHEEYEKMLADQDGKCAICERPQAEASRGVLQVDHDHLTNNIRGLLCHHCNTALGNLQDSIALLQRALQYLIAGGSHST